MKKLIFYIFISIVIVILYICYPSFISMIYNWLYSLSLSKSDWILLLTFFAIVWYTIETSRLRKWQQRSVQISIFDLRQRLLMHADEMRKSGNSADLNLHNRDTINMMNDILEQGKFDFKKLYAPGIIKEESGSGIKKYFKKIIKMK